MIQAHTGGTINITRTDIERRADIITNKQNIQNFTSADTGGIILQLQIHGCSHILKVVLRLTIGFSDAQNRENVRELMMVEIILIFLRQVWDGF